MSLLKTQCRNMTVANAYISNILNSYGENEIVNNKYINELITYHPTKNISINNIDFLKMKIRSPFNKLALFYKNIDNDIDEDISWKLCIRNIYGKYDKIKTQLQNIQSAFRFESHFGSKNDFYVKNTTERIGTCVNCNIKSDKMTVDHYPIPFKEILNTFIINNNILFETIEVIENCKLEIKFKDTVLAKQWLDYHDKNAEYRLLCLSCNAHFGCYKDLIKKK